MKGRHLKYYPTLDSIASGSICFLLRRSILLKLVVTTQGPVILPAVQDRTNLCGALEVNKYLTGIVSTNRLAEFECELRLLIDKCKDDEALYNAIQIASGLNSFGYLKRLCIFAKDKQCYAWPSLTT